LILHASVTSAIVKEKIVYTSSQNQQAPSRSAIIAAFLLAPINKTLKISDPITRKLTLCAKKVFLPEKNT
jgi:hypothetical protein